MSKRIGGLLQGRYLERQAARNARPGSLAAMLCAAGLAVCAPASADDGAYDLGFTYVLDLMRVQSGGIEQGNGDMHNLDLTLEVDAERAWGLRNGTAFIYFLGNAGDLFNETHVGSIQGVSNIEADQSFKLFEAWYEHAFANSTLRLGLYDLNAEFDAIETAGLFINPSHGMGADYAQSGLNGPSSFPVTSAGVRYAAQLPGQGYWQAAVLDGVSGHPGRPRGTHVHFSSDDGALIALQAGQVNAEGEPRRHYALGIWHYTERTTESAAGEPVSQRNRGLYAFAERALGSDTAAYVRLGVADASVNQISSYIGAGLVRSGMFGRPDDQAGIAVAVANNSSDYTDATGSEDREVIWELTYRSQITDWFAVQPDIQYIQNPGTDPALDDALVLGLRFEAAF